MADVLPPAERERAAAEPRADDAARPVASESVRSPSELRAGASPSGVWRASPALRRRLRIGPTREGRWIVADADGLCGAVFVSREEALRFVKAECGATPPWTSQWRFVAALGWSALFARRRRD